MKYARETGSPELELLGGGRPRSMKYPSSQGCRREMVIDDGSVTDYAIQIQAMGAAQRWLDPEDA